LRFLVLLILKLDLAIILFYIHLPLIFSFIPWAEEKREAGGQGEFSVGLAARRDVASQPAT
jgi:hypothetical protein